MFSVYIMWHMYRGIPTVEREGERLHAYLDEKLHALEVCNLGRTNT